MSGSGTIRTDIPWFKEFVADTLSDLRYLELSDEGKGQRAHLRLLCWRHGSIPADKAALSRTPYCSGPILPEVLAMFSKRGDRLFDPALEKQRRAYMEKCRKNTDNGRLGGRRKKTQAVKGNRSVTDGLANASDLASEQKPEEKKEEKRSEKPLAHAVSSRSLEPETAGASPQMVSVEKAVKDLAHEKRLPWASQKTPEEVRRDAETVLRDPKFRNSAG